MGRIRSGHREEYAGSLYGFNHPYSPAGDYDRPWRSHYRNRYDLNRRSYFNDEFSNSRYDKRWQAEDEDRWNQRDYNQRRLEEEQRYRDYEAADRTGMGGDQFDDYDPYTNHDRDSWDESGYGWHRLRHQHPEDYMNRDRDNYTYDAHRSNRDTYVSRGGRWDDGDDWENRWRHQDNDREFSNERYPAHPEDRFSRSNPPGEHPDRLSFRDEDAFENVGNYGGRYSQSVRSNSGPRRRWRGGGRPRTGG